MGYTLHRIRKAAQMVGLHEDTLRNYEQLGLIRPQRDSNGARLYTEADLKQIREIALSRAGEGTAPA